VGEISTSSETPCPLRGRTALAVQGVTTPPEKNQEPKSKDLVMIDRHCFFAHWIITSSQNRICLYYI